MVTNKERIQANNGELREAIELAKNLPDAGGGESTPTQEKTVDIVANGTVEVIPDEGYALSKVTANVNVPIPEGYIQPRGELEITENGIYDVTDKESVNVNVPEREIVLQDKTITENGTYSADEGYDGLGSVTVEVASSGGGGEVNMNTCTIKITVPSSSNYYSAYEKVSNGSIVYQIDRNYAGGTLTKTMRCGSVAYIQASTIKGATVSDGEILRFISGYGVAYKAPSTAGVTVDVTLTA